MQSSHRQPLFEQYLAMAAFRAEVEQQFCLLLGPWVELAEVSRSEEPITGAGGPFQESFFRAIYSCHAFAFWPLFPEVPEPAIQDLNRAARLYADYYLLFDRIIDHDMLTAKQAAAMFKATFLLQQSLGILYRYFPAQSRFWQEFNRHQGELIQAVAFEKAIGEGNVAHPYHWDDFEEIARGKNAMLKCTIAALATLTDASVTRVARLYALFDEVAIFGQVYNDFWGWRTDLEEDKPTYVLHAFLDEMGLDRSSALALGEKALKRHFFLSDTLQGLLTEVQHRLDVVRVAADWGQCEHWLEFLKTCSLHLQHTREHIEMTRARVRKLAAGPVTSSPTQRAAQFLVMSQSPDGVWSDFTLGDMGPSSDWVTGYVASILQQQQHEQQSLEHAVRWLLDHRFPNGGWGFHRGVAADADSTAACLSFLASRLPLDETGRAVQALLSFQDATGGFCTYSSETVEDLVPITEEEKERFTGWCMPHTCVTAAAIMALCGAQASHQENDLHAAIAAAIRYLLRQQRDDGSWQAYWWQGGIYATAFSLRALRMATKDTARHPDIAEAARRALSFLLAEQLPNGGWSVDGAATVCPFQTGLALGALAQFPGNVPPSAVRAAIQALLQAQQPSGCWKASAPIMRIPQISDTHPWDWQTRSTTPPLLSRDQNNFFTTATVLYALEQANRLEQA